MGRSRVLKRRPSGLTISDWMVISIVVAILCWLTRRGSIDSLLAKGLLYTILAILTARVMILILYMKHCPVCRKGPVGLVKAVPFGNHYFQCTSCGQRMKRAFLGQMWDASGPEDDIRFQTKEQPVQTWGKNPVVSLEETPETRTMVGLLKEKIHRSSETSPGLDLVPGDRDWIDVRGEADPQPSKPAPSLGVKSDKARALFESLESIRCSRPPES